MLFLQLVSLFDLLFCGVDAESLCMLKSDGSLWTFLGDLLLRAVLHSGFSLLSSKSWWWRENQATAVLLGSCLYWKPIWYPSTFTNTAGASIIKLARNVIMLKNVPELNVSSYTVEGLLEIVETSLQNLQTCLAWLWWNRQIVPQQHSVVLSTIPYPDHLWRKVRTGGNFFSDAWVVYKNLHVCLPQQVPNISGGLSQLGRSTLYMYQYLALLAFLSTCIVVKFHQHFFDTGRLFKVI